MKITKFVHACLLVEMPASTNRTALFDPGSMSQEALSLDSLEYLDDIIITHSHPDHYHLPLIQQLVAKFPEVRITAPPDVVKDLQANNITATDQPSDGIVFFDAPHEDVAPLFPRPEQRAVHYLERLTHPGDSHSFNKTKAILALPISGPWASTVKAVNLALELQPKFVLPIHDWHLSDAAREQIYSGIEGALQEQGITLVKLQTGQPETLDV